MPTKKKWLYVKWYFVKQKYIWRSTPRIHRIFSKSPAFIIIAVVVVWSAGQYDEASANFLCATTEYNDCCSGMTRALIKMWAFYPKNSSGATGGYRSRRCVISLSLSVTLVTLSSIYADTASKDSGSGSKMLCITLINLLISTASEAPSTLTTVTALGTYGVASLANILRWRARKHQPIATLSHFGGVEKEKAKAEKCS